MIYIYRRIGYQVPYMFLTQAGGQIFNDKLYNEPKRRKIAPLNLLVV